MGSHDSRRSQIPHSQSGMIQKNNRIVASARAIIQQILGDLARHSSRNPPVRSGRRKRPIASDPSDPSDDSQSRTAAACRPRPGTRLAFGTGSQSHRGLGTPPTGRSSRARPKMASSRSGSSLLAMAPAQAHPGQFIQAPDDWLIELSEERGDLLGGSGSYSVGGDGSDSGRWRRAGP